MVEEKKVSKVWLIVFLVAIFSVIAAQSGGAYPSGATAELGGIDALANRLAEMVGVGGLFAMVINLGKRWNWIKQGSAADFSTGLNLLALFAIWLAPIIGLELDYYLIDQGASGITQIATTVLQFVSAFGGAKATHAVLSGSSVLGASFSGGDV